MSWLRRLERRLQPLAIPHLTQLLIAGQVMVFLICAIKPEAADLLVMRPQEVLAGQWWRLLTFLIIPSGGLSYDFVSILFFIFFLMFLHLMGSALEATWGTVRFNLFVLIGYLSSIGSVLFLELLLHGNMEAPNAFIYQTIFLAFAYLFPEFEIILFFFLPVKVKWLGLLTIVITGFIFLGGLATFMQGGWVMCTLILAAGLNLSLFLGRDIADRLRRTNARMIKKFSVLSQVKGSRHLCCVCGATELSHPERDFRYCTECAGTPGYCNLHLAGHTHRTTSDSTPPGAASWMPPSEKRPSAIGEKNRDPQ